MLTANDIMRLDEIMERTMAAREQRGCIPDRDEDKIAEILFRAEESARREREALVEANYGFASNVRHQEPARNSDESTEFSSLSRWKNREIDSD